MHATYKHMDGPFWSICTKSILARVCEHVQQLKKQKTLHKKKTAPEQKPNKKRVQAREQCGKVR